jgi:hypothetical protein
MWIRVNRQKINHKNPTHQTYQKHYRRTANKIPLVDQCPFTEAS